MKQLKLVALDEEDLAVLSAHLQDAVLRVGEMAFLPHDRRFAFMADRHDAGDLVSPVGCDGRERRRTGVHFNRVLKVSTRGIDRGNPGETLDLLGIQFLPGDTPGGDIELMFAGGKDIRLTVECVEAELRCFGAVEDFRTAEAV